MHALLKRQLKRFIGESAIALGTEPGFEAKAPANFSGQPGTEPTARSKGRILIADDNQVNQLVALEVLQKYGHICHAVNDGANAVAAALSGDYDLVLMDCSMPGMDGLEATRRIRLAEQAASANPPRHIPIIALTANAINGDRERCIEAGMDDYQTKPLDPYQLMQAIERFLSQSEQASAADKESTGATLNNTAEAASKDPPPFSIDELLDRCLGNAEAVAMILDEFEKQAAVDLEEIKRSVEGGDCEAMARTAHALKGASGMLSAAALSSVAYRLEHLGRSGSLAGAKPLLAELSAEIQRVVDSLPAARSATIEKPSSVGSCYRK